jgi:hypothetical protein
VSIDSLSPADFHRMHSHGQVHQLCRFALLPFFAYLSLARMLTFPSTLVQGVTAGLCLYKVESKTEITTIISDGTLRIEKTDGDKWKIGLRENLADAVERATKISGPIKDGVSQAVLEISKESLVVLEITFTPLGLAHYTKMYTGPDYRFRPMLQKMSYRGDTDWKVWHFHGDLPLRASDLQDNVLITTRLMEIF